MTEPELQAVLTVARHYPLMAREIERIVETVRAQRAELVRLRETIHALGPTGGTDI